MHIFIDTYKVKLEVQDELFVLSDGENIRKFSPYKIKSINIIKHCTLTSYAIMFASRHEIPVIIYDKGKVQVWCWSHKYGTIADIRINQAFFSRDESRLEWIAHLLVLKSEEQLSVLSWIKNRKTGLQTGTQEAINRITELQKQFLKKQKIDSLRAVEGQISRIYWEIVFKAYGHLTSANTREKRYADDIFNMSINYCYGILYGMVEASLVMVGLDPYIGLFHINRHDRPVLAFDHIEPFRPWVDKLVIETLQKADENMELIVEEGELKELSLTYRKILITNFFEMMEERAYSGGHRIKRRDHVHQINAKLVALLKTKKYSV